MNIFIGTPAYGGMVHIDYLSSILDYHKAKLPITVMNIGNESLITRGRNTILSYFYAMTDFTHLLFLDADMSLSAEGLIKLLEHEKDVIGAKVRLKGTDENGDPVWNIWGVEGQGDLVKVDKLGTAVMILSRYAVGRLIEDAPIYKGNKFSRGAAYPIPIYDVFRCGSEDGEYLSEDYWVCRTLQQKDIDIYVDLSVHTKHNGNYCFE